MPGIRLGIDTAVPLGGGRVAASFAPRAFGKEGEGGWRGVRRRVPAIGVVRAGVVQVAVRCAKISRFLFLDFHIYEVFR